MKKGLLFAFSLLAAGSLSAQITLDSTSIASVGETFVLGVDTSLAAGYDIGQPGTNLTWDFSQLNQDEYDTIRFVDPSSTPYGGDYPNANLAVEQASMGAGAYAYFELTAAKFDLLGFAADPFQMGTPFIVRQNPALTTAVFPANYGDTYRDTSSYSVTLDGAIIGIPGVDSVRYTSSSEYDVVYDSWGTMILWGGSYSALRSKEVRNTRDMVDIQFFGSWTNFQDTSYTDSTFRWMNDTKGYFLAEARYIGGVLDDISYLDPNPVSVKNALVGGVQIFPNPASERIVVVSDAVAAERVELYNLQGQLVRAVAVDGVRNEVSLEGLRSGWLLVRVFGENGVVLDAKKVLVK